MSFLSHSENVPVQTRGWFLKEWVKDQHQNCGIHPRLTESEESASKQSPQVMSLMLNSRRIFIFLIVFMARKPYIFYPFLKRPIYKYLAFPTDSF